MKRRVENWSIEKLARERTRISFPEYQRQPNLWSTQKKALLIDSILRDIDIPKLYFNETASAEIEVVDGTQRLWAIWDFIDDFFQIDRGGKEKKFSQLLASERSTIKKYELQVTVLEDAREEYLRTLFLRLQIGLLLVTGEKLHAGTGAMKDFVFSKLVSHKFVRALAIPKRRYAKETLCSQVALNSFTQAKNHSFARTRYEDLDFFYKEYENPQGKDLQFFRTQSARILEVLDGLEACFGTRASGLTNRSYILSIYLLFEELRGTLSSTNDKRVFVDFVFAFWKRLKQEGRAGMDRTNRELYAFETLMSSAPGERYQIERRHQKLSEFLDHYRRTGKIKGDK